MGIANRSWKPVLLIMFTIVVLEEGGYILLIARVNISPEGGGGYR